MSRVVVIGAGLSGLVAAIRLARGGASVTLVTKGSGPLTLGQGTVDILGYAPERVSRPLDALAAYAAATEGHPYAYLGADDVRAGVEYLAGLVGPKLLVGDPEVNLQLPTAVGAVRPTALASPSMTAGACVDGAQFVLVGFKQLKDFHPLLVAENLSRTTLPGGGRLSARAVSMDFAARTEADSFALTYARAFDDPGYRRRFAEALRPNLRDDEIVGLPAVLGLQDPDAWTNVQDLLGHPVFEIPLPPPSVPGMRLDRALTALAKDAGVRLVPGPFVARAEALDGRVRSVTADSAGDPRTYAADAFVYCPGGFESGALEFDSYGAVSERLFDLPLVVPEGELLHGEYWGPPQPLFRVGVAVDAAMRPVDADGRPAYANLHVAGGILAGAIRWQEKSGEGIALASALRAADAVLGFADPAAPSAADQEVPA